MKQRICRSIAVCFFTALVGIGASTSQASVIIGNLDAYTNSSSSSTITSKLPSDSGKALGFTMGASAYTLSGIDLRLTISLANASSVPTLEVWSVNTTTGNMNLVLATLSTAGPVTASDSSQIIAFAPSQALTLAANTSYYIVPRVSTDGTYLWMAGSPSVSATGVGATVLDGRFGSFSAGPNTWTSISSVQNWYRISGDLAPIPEPASFAVFAGMVVLGGALVTRLRRRPGSP